VEIPQLIFLININAELIEYINITTKLVYEQVLSCY